MSDSHRRSNVRWDYAPQPTHVGGHITQIKAVTFLRYWNTAHYRNAPQNTAKYRKIRLPFVS